MWQWQKHALLVYVKSLYRCISAIGDCTPSNIGYHCWAKKIGQTLLFLICYQYNIHISWDVLEIQRQKSKQVFCFGSKVKFLKDYLVKKAHKLLQVPITNLKPSKTKPQRFPCSVLWTSLLFVLAAIHTAIWATSSLTKTKADSLSLWPAVVVSHPCWHTQPRPALSVDE